MFQNIFTKLQLSLSLTDQDTTEIGPVHYKFLCNGRQVLPSAPATTSKIYVKNNIIGIIGEGYGADQSLNYASLRSVPSTSVTNFTLTKTFAQTGLDSTYTFNVKVAAKIENLITTIRFKAGSQFYIEFARDISPRFNKLGIISCYHEGYPTYCSYESERRIALIARTDLDHDLTYGHNFSVVGIQRYLCIWKLQYNLCCISTKFRYIQ